MKKMILTALMFVVLYTSYAQETSPTSTDNNTRAKTEVETLLEKSRNQKIGGWCFLGGGAICLGIGIATFPNDYDPLFDTNSESTDSKASTATTLIIVGGAAMLGSIPFFISSAVKKHKAAKLSVKTEKTGFGLPFKTDVTGLSISIPLGR